MALLYFGGRWLPPQGADDQRSRSSADENHQIITRFQPLPQILGSNPASRMCRRISALHILHEMKHVNPAAASAITHEPSVSAASAQPAIDAGTNNRCSNR